MSNGAAIRPMNARSASILLRLAESSASEQWTFRSCILDASGLDGRQAKRLLEEVNALRKALESHHSISKDPKHRSNVDRVR